MLAFHTFLFEANRAFKQLDPTEPGSNPGLLQYGVLFSLPSVLLQLTPPSFTQRDIQVAREQTLKPHLLLTAFKAKEQPGWLRSPLSLRQEGGMHLPCFLSVLAALSSIFSPTCNKIFCILSKYITLEDFKELTTYLSH